MNRKTTKRLVTYLFTSILLVTECIQFTVEKAYASSTEKTPQEIVSQMSIEQKIGQMIMPAFRKWNGEKVTAINDQITAAIKKYGFGGIVLFAENTQGTAQTTELIYDMQQAAMSPDSLSCIPMLMSVDQEGGYIYRIGTGTSFCGNMALGANGNTDDVKATANVIGDELKHLGFQIDFAPDMDINNNPANPVIGVRSFSSNPQLVGKLGCAYIEGLNQKNIASAVKHFPGHGDTGTDSHTGLPLIDKTYEQIKGCELIPFKMGIDKGVDIVMTAHIQYPKIETNTYTSIMDNTKVNLPATLSKTIITDILRGDMGFDGVVSTDAMNMDAIAKNFKPEDAASLAINADVDILLMPVDMSTQEGIDSMETYIDGIVNKVHEGIIDERTITKSAERIISLKIKRGLFDSVTETKEEKVANAKKVVGSKANHDLEMEITKKAITLLKNDDETLPIKSSDGDNIAMFCASDNEINCMQYAIDELRSKDIISENTKVNIYCYKDRSIEDFKSVIDDADQVIASVDTTKAANLDPTKEAGWQGVFIDSLISQTHDRSKKITVISAHLPYDAARFNKADAILLAYCSKGMNELPTEYLGETKAYGPNISAAVLIAFGEQPPTGKLPVDIMELTSDYQFSNTVMYGIGYGMTYITDEEEKKQEQNDTNDEHDDKKQNVDDEKNIVGQETVKDTKNEVTTSPKTSDMNGLGVMIVLLALSGILILCCKGIKLRIRIRKGSNL